MCSTQLTLEMLILRTCQAISTLPERISATTKSANQRHARSLALACWRTSHSQSTDTSGMMHSVAMLFVLGTLVTCSFGAHSAISDLPNVTSSGHLTLQKSDGSEMFYAYYESKTPATQATPVLLWLQVDVSSASAQTVRSYTAASGFLLSCAYL